MADVARRFSEWSEECGDVLWWRFPVQEPPYLGSPLDLGFNVCAKLYDQFGNEVGSTNSDVGGWPFASDEEANLYWTPLAIPENPEDHHG